MKPDVPHKTLGIANKYLLIGFIIVVGIATISTGTLSTVTADYFYGHVCDNSTEVNVKCFGAVGNGIADDSTAIQAAVNYLGNGTDVLVFPIGDYNISTTIYFNVSKGKTIKGLGQAWTTATKPTSRIMWNGTTQQPIFWFTDGSSGNHIQHLGFVNGSEAIRFRNTSSGADPIKNNYVEYNVFSNQQTASVWVGFPASDPVSDMDMDGYYFIGNQYVAGNMKGVVLNAHNNGHRSVFDKESYFNTNTSIFLLNWVGISVTNSFFANQGSYTNYSIEACILSGGGGGGVANLENIMSENAQLFNEKVPGCTAWGAFPSAGMLTLRNIMFNLAVGDDEKMAVQSHYSVYAENVQSASTADVYVNSTNWYVTVNNPAGSATTHVKFNASQDITKLFYLGASNS